MNEFVKSIKEVSADEMPSRNGARDKWKSLASELVLRLEKTPPSKALLVEFSSKDELRKATASLQKWFRIRGVSVTTRKRLENGSAMLYVRRGPNYKK